MRKVHLSSNRAHTEEMKVQKQRGTVANSSGGFSHISLGTLPPLKLPKCCTTSGLHSTLDEAKILTSHVSNRNSIWQVAYNNGVPARESCFQDEEFTLMTRCWERHRSKRIALASLKERLEKVLDVAMDPESGNYFFCINN